jgi:hypothetical protein
MKCGYIFTKIKDTLIVKVEHLLPNTEIKVKVRCDYCGKEKYITYFNYNRNIKKYNMYACCVKCSYKKIRQTNLIKYGCEHPSQNKDVREKTINTNLKLYNVEYPTQNAVIKEKIIQTNLIKYGCENPSQNENIKEKRKQTCIDKYDVDNPMKNDNIKNKLENINLKKYGCKSSLGNEKVKKKIENTNIKIYGNKIPSKTDIVINKIIETNIEKYGFNCPLQNKEIELKSKQTLFKNYGVYTPIKNEFIKAKIIKTQIEKHGEVFYNFFPKYNTFSIYVFDLLSEKLNINIRHALNGGEKKFHKYFVDGFVIDYNIVIEWDESGHNRKIQINNDIKRQTYIETNFGCVFIRVNQSEYLKNEHNQFKLLLNRINNIIKTKKVH